VPYFHLILTLLKNLAKSKQKIAQKATKILHKKQVKNWAKSKPILI